MSDWSALALPRVNEPDLRKALKDRGIRWEDALHVTATASLAKEFRASGAQAVSIANLLALVTERDESEPEAAPVFPILRDFTNAMPAYSEAIRVWQNVRNGHLMKESIKCDYALRNYARNASGDQQERAVLVNGRREFLRSVRSLIASGFMPNDVRSGNALSTAAKGAWAQLEAEVPSLSLPREDLWPERYEEEPGRYQAQSLSRVRAAIERAFGRSDSPRPLVLHGFYFYTPAQWAFFRLLHSAPEFDCTFIVHDDGRSPMFRTWRLFFNEKWSMPTPQPVAADGEPSELASPLEAALSGEHVPSSAEVPRLSVIRYRTPAALISGIRQETHAAEISGKAHTEFFAAKSQNVARYASRLGGESGSNIDLAHLPVGVFLLALHDCIRARPDGAVELRMSEAAVLDMFASGFLAAEDEAGTAAQAMRKAREFFRGCDEPAMWTERGVALERMIISGVSTLGARLDEQSDIERIRVAASNPLRLVPWGDLSATEAAALSRGLREVESLLRQIAAREVSSIREHMALLRPRLVSGMRGLPEFERADIAAKLSGLSSSANDEVDVEGLVDIVSMLLGRHVEQLPEDDEEESRNDGRVKELRSLDVLAFRRAQGDVHVANLSDGNFPASVSAAAWPFTAADLKEAVGSPPESIELLETRSLGSAASDLYLLWVALNSVGEGNRLRLSWISEISGEACHPSALLALMTRVDSPSEAVRERAGGLTPESRSIGERQLLSRPTFAIRASTVNESEANAVVDQLDSLAASSAYLCPRRVALQWVVGPSGAFLPEHLQSMLFGNTLGAIYLRKLMEWEEAKLAVSGMWRHLTVGQRLSSRTFATIKSRGTKPPWIMNLRGSRKDTSQSPWDMAYKAALGDVPITFDLLAPESSRSRILPMGVDDPEVCRFCPVSPRCSQRVIDE